MPTITIRYAGPVLPDAAAQRLAQDACALVACDLGKNPAVTSTSVAAMGQGVWLVGDAAPPNVAQMEVTITEGSNSVAEKQAFLTNGHALLTRYFPRLSKATYVTLREVAATDWGYGGLSQAARKMAL